MSTPNKASKPGTQPRPSMPPESLIKDFASLVGTSPEKLREEVTALNLDPNMPWDALPRLACGGMDPSMTDYLDLRNELADKTCPHAEIHRQYKGNDCSCTGPGASKEDSDSAKYVPDGFDALDYPHVSKATPPTCPGSCKDCTDQYIPMRWQKAGTLVYMEKHSDKEAETLLSVTRIAAENLEYISGVIAKYGNTILKRWQKRSAEKRAAILRLVFPQMHKNRWVQSRDRYARASVITLEGSCLPFLDIEGLSSNPARLPALLRARTSHAPAEWITHDLMSQKVGWEESCCKTYNPHCIVITKEHFGELVQWDMERAHGMEIVGFPRAIHAFGAQYELAGFLHRIVDALLPDMRKALQGRDLWDAAAEVGFRDVNAVAQVPYYNLAFSSPPRFDTGRVEEMLRSRCDVATHELIQMQLDPLYMRERLARAQSTVQYSKMDAEDQLQHLVELTLIPITQVDVADYLFQEASILLTVLRNHEDDVRPGSAMPEEYASALQALSTMLNSHYRTQVESLYRMIREVGAFEKHFFTTSDGGRGYRTGPDEALRSDPLFWNVMQLTYVGMTNQKPSYHLALIDDILAKTSKKYNNRIDRRICDHLSDMAMIDEAVMMIEHHRPRVGDVLSKKETQEVFEHFGVTRHYDCMFGLLSLWDEAEDEMTAPLKEFLDLPMSSTKVNRETFLRTKNLHAGHKKYWTAVRNFRERVTPTLDCPAMGVNKYTEYLNVASTDEYEAAVGEELSALRAAVEAKERAAEARRSSIQPSPIAETHVQTVWGRTPEDEVSKLATPKTKAKTRPSAMASLTDATNQLRLIHPDEVVEFQPFQIEVDSVSLQLFQRMFRPLLSSKGTSCVRWDDFVSVMLDSGCTVRQHGGSAITFLWSAPYQVGGSCVVHRPHPDPSINPICLGSIGRKLTRYFGWDEDTFVERKKGKESKTPE